MKLLLKIILGLLLITGALLVAGGLFLGFVFDPNSYKADIEKVALDEGGVELQIQGQIGWSVFPWLGLELNRINAGFPGQPQLAALEKAQVSVELMPLLSGQVQMKSIVFDGVNLTLVKQSETLNNWTPPNSTASSDDQHDSSRGDSPAIGIDIESIALTNSQLRYTDKTNGSEAALTDLNLTTGRLLPESEIPLSLGFNVKQKGAEAGSDLALNLKLTSSLRFSLLKQQVSLNKLNADLLVTTAALGAKPLPVHLQADLAANGADKSVSLDNLLLSLAGIELNGDLKASQQANQSTFAGNLSSKPFNLKTTLQSLGQPEVITTDPAALTNLKLALRVVGNDKQLNIDNLKLQLDDTQFSGNVGYRMADGMINLKLLGDAINADRYLPPADPTAEATPAPAEKSAEPYPKTPLLPVDSLKELNLNASVGLNSLIIQKMAINNIQLAVSAAKGLIKVEKADLEMYQGKVSNRITLDLRKTPITLSSEKTVSNIALGELILAATESQPITGTLNTSSSITAQGNSIFDIVNSLNGKFSLNLKDGVINGIDIAQKACQTLNNVASLGVNAQQVDQSTPFANLSASGKITNGVISNQDLNTLLDAILLTGRGNIDLPKQGVDYRVALTIKENLFKKTCSINNKIEGVEWPVDCKGKFDTPPAEMCKPDLSVIKDLLKQEIKKKVETKVMDSLKDKLGGNEGASKLLKGLFGN